MDQRLINIFRRRSIRTYTDKMVAEKDIQSLLEAGMAAPSASNKKPWHFVVIQDRECLSALAEAHPYGKMLSEASLCIAVCGDPEISEWWIQDCSAATQNILIAVTSLGLGAVWLGCQGRVEREKAVRKILDIPDFIGILSLIAVGYPAEEKAARTQYESSREHREVW